MKQCIWLIVSLFGCSDDGGSDQGTVVGNPGDAKFRMAESDSVEVEHARTVVDEVVWLGCDGGEEVVEVEREVDLLDDVSVALPVGDWCGLAVGLSEPLQLEMYVADWDKDVVLYLEFDGLLLDAPSSVETNDSDVVLEWGFPGWFSGQQRDLERWVIEEDAWDDEEPVELTEESSMHDGLAEVFADASAVFLDSNGDGWVGEDERAQGPLASGQDHPQYAEILDEEEEQMAIDGGVNTGQQEELTVGPGCASSESNLTWIGLFPVLLMGRRRPLSAG